MAVYAYHARDTRHRAQQGTISADSPALARHALRQRGLVISRISTVTTQQKSHWSRRRNASATLCEVWRQLALLLRAGVPLATALEVLTQQHRGWMQAILRELHEAVQSGRALADALETRPQLFDTVTISVIQVGQTSGSLDLALESLAEFASRRENLRQRLTNVLIYPCILCVVGLAVVLFMMTYVVPQLVEVLEAAGRSLPLATRWLKTGSDFLITGWPALVAIAVLLICVAVPSFRHPRRRRQIERVTLRIPVAGDLLRKSWIAHVTLLLSLLLRANVRFVEALRIIRQGLRQRVLADELQRLETAVEAGSDIAPPLANSVVFPPLAVHVLGIGQNTGELPRMLDQLREGYDSEVTVATTRFLALLEPVLVLVMASVIGFVLYASLLPILEATRAIQ